MPVRRGFKWLNRVRGLPRRERDLRWVAESTSITLAAQAGNTGVRTALISVGDYDFSGGAAEPKGVTVMAMRVLIGIESPRVNIPAVVPNSGAVCMLGIGRFDADDAAYAIGGHSDPRVIQELIEEDWMWMGLAMARDLQVRYLDINLRVKRKLVDQVVSFAASVDQTGAGSGDWVFRVSSRSLLKFS